jgi:hypothetical protein
MPCTSYSYLKSFGDAFVCLKIHNSSQYCEVSEKSHTVLWGQITNDNRRNVMLVLLRFPAGSNLTTEHYAANKVTGKLNSEIMPCLATHNVAGKKVEQWVDFIQWKVALYKAKPCNIREASLAEQPKGMAKAAVAMNHMSIG